jgi:hypothetical protein
VADTFKLNVKLGGSEFSAEGPEDAVKEQYKQWLDLVAKFGTGAPGLARDGGREAQPRGDAVTSQSGAGGRGDDAVDEDVLMRVYEVDRKGEGVSLRVLPSGGKPDALILLLYGFHHFFSNHAVLGTQLGKAARISGVQVDRVDRAIEPNADKLTVAGFRKGRAYGLNNPGLAYARKLLSEILK